MSDLSRRANQVLDEARASRPALDRRRKERVRQAVAATVATTAVAAGAQAAQAVGATKSVATAWVTTTMGKVVLGVGAAVVGSGLTVGVMSARRAAVTVVRPAVEPGVGSRSGTFTTAPRAQPMNAASAAPDAARPQARTAAAEVHLAPSHATAQGVEAPSGPAEGAPDDARRSDKPAPVAARDGARIVGGPASGGAGLAANSGSPNSPQTPLDRTTPEVAVSAPALVPTADARDSSRELAASPRPERAPSARQSETGGSETPFGSTGGSGRPPPEPAAPLRDELTVLRLAKAQHDAGHFTAALASLDEYDTRFPAGVMAVESQVLRVLTLCELGRQPDARAVLTALQRKTPKSPAVTRLKTSCAAE